MLKVSLPLDVMVDEDPLCAMRGCIIRNVYLALQFLKLENTVTFDFLSNLFPIKVFTYGYTKANLSNTELKCLLEN